MKRRAAWEVFARVAVEQADATALVFAEFLSVAPVVYANELTHRATVSAFFPRRPVAEAWRRLRAALRVVVPGCRPPLLRRVKDENWAESWKRHFKPIAVGDALLVKPSWSRQSARRGQSVVVLDPGLSFGTGQHATTGFCLRELARRRRADARQSFLDMGTGSGILALAAAKLGYEPVAAFDFDPDAVRIARANARRNRVAQRLRIRRQNLEQLPLRAERTFDVVCANLIATLLITQSRRITARVAPGGCLVLAGILDTQFPTVRRHYERAGWRLVRTRREKEWRSGTFMLPA
jgi:ribosomal protein L11 methyltransferase